MIPREELSSKTLTRKRIGIVLVAFCVLAVTVGLASVPMLAPGGGTASGGSGPATDASVAAAGGSGTGNSVASSENASATENAASDGSTNRTSDCDLIDIDGNDNTVSVNISNNTTDGVNVRYHCGAGNAVLDHDLIDIDGNNNTVTVFVQAENGTVAFGEDGSSTDSSGLHVALQCAGDTPADCDAVDIDGHNNAVTLVVLGEEGQTIHEFGANSSETRTEERTG